MAFTLLLRSSLETTANPTQKHQVDLDMEGVLRFMGNWGLAVARDSTRCRASGFHPFHCRIQDPVHQHQVGHTFFGSETWSHFGVDSSPFPTPQSRPNPTGVHDQSIGFFQGWIGGWRRRFWAAAACGPQGFHAAMCQCWLCWFKCSKKHFHTFLCGACWVHLWCVIDHAAHESPWGTGYWCRSEGGRSL